MKSTKLMKSTIVALSLVLAGGAQAAITGQVDVKLNISSGCQVGGSEVSGNMNKFGELDFGKQSPQWTNVLTAEVQGANNGGDLEVTCDAGVSGFGVSINGGERGNRTLSEAGGDTVEYGIYQNAARSNEYAVDTPVQFSYAGAPVAIPIYGAIAPNSGTAKTAGDYTDVLLVSVTF